MTQNSLQIAELHKKGETQAEAGQLTEAAETYQQILALNPDDLEAVISLGNIGFHVGDINQAVRWYLKAAALNPENNELVMSVSCMLMDLGYPTEAGQLTDAFFAGEKELLLHRIEEAQKIF